MIYKQMLKYFLIALACSVVLCGALYGGSKIYLERIESGRPTPGPVQVWKGTLKSGFEVYAFVPCGGTEWWDITGKTSKASNLIDQLRAGPRDYTTIYVDLNGRLSPEGRYGHLGGYKHQLLVDEVVVAQKEFPPTCR